MHLNSLFKVGEAPNVASQLDDFLGSRSTVLDYAHPGLITCKLERKALHGDPVFWLMCYVYKLALCSVNISAPHPSYLIISKLEEESHWRDIKASSKTGDNIFHSHFLFWGLFSGRYFLAAFKLIYLASLWKKQHKPQVPCGLQRPRKIWYEIQHSHCLKQR